MSIKISPAILEATYELLRSTWPKDLRRLPHAEDISFSVIADKGNRGEFYVDANGTPWIVASQPCHHTLDELLRTVAHEMCHLYEYLYGERKDIHHGAWFNRVANRICRVHQFDRGAF